MSEISEKSKTITWRWIGVAACLLVGVWGIFFAHPKPKVAAPPAQTIAATQIPKPPAPASIAPSALTPSVTPTEPDVDKAVLRKFVRDVEAPVQNCHEAFGGLTQTMRVAPNQDALEDQLKSVVLVCGNSGGELVSVNAPPDKDDRFTGIKQFCIDDIKSVLKVILPLYEKIENNKSGVNSHIDYPDMKEAKEHVDNCKYGLAAVKSDAGMSD